MKHFATITPTRGDRPALFEFCKYQLSRMQVKPTKSYFINHLPVKGIPDISLRVMQGIQMAKADGIEFVFIIEDDDYYPATYFNKVSLDCDFIGCSTSVYYTLRYRQYQSWQHPRHSSLFTTGFRIASLDKFNWPEPKNKFIDIPLWEYAKKIKLRVFEHDGGAIGIKHGLGMCGGKGHVQRMKYDDKNYEWLKANVDDDAYKFYKQLL